MTRVQKNIASLIASLLATTTLGCTNTVTPPAHVADPVTIYLVDQGRTSSLLLPSGNGKSVRWAYGNWNWYALGNKGPLDALAAMLIPSKAALGRREMNQPRDTDAIRAEVDSIQYLYAIQVEREREQNVSRRLEGEFLQNNTGEVNNRESDLSFVRVNSCYWAFHDSNHVVSAWLEEMGCEVKGSKIYSVWDVKTP